MRQEVSLLSRGLYAKLFTHVGNSHVEIFNPEPESNDEKGSLSVEAAQQLLIEGQNLPVDPQLFAALRHGLDMVQNWEQRLEEVGQRQVKLSLCYLKLCHSYSCYVTHPLKISL